MLILVFLLLKYGKYTQGKLLLIFSFFVQESLLVFFLFPIEANFNYFFYIVTPITFFIFDLDKPSDKFYIVFINFILITLFLLSEILHLQNPLIQLTYSQLKILSLLSALCTMGSIIFVFYHYSLSINSTTRELLYLAETDGLTELLNRRTLFKIGKEVTAKSFIDNTEFTFIIMDIDYFKNINDTWGHQIGDDVLKAFTQLISSNIRSSDNFFRYGGEEFALILSDTSNKAGMRVAEELRLLVSKTVLKVENNIDINLTISVGVSFFKKSKCDFEGIVKSADNALYKAKNLGRNRVVKEQL